MKTKRTTLGIIVTSVVLLVASSLCFAQGRPGRAGRDAAFGPPVDAPGPRMARRGPAFDGPGPGLPILRAIRHLDLTQEQRKEIRTVLEANAEGMEAARGGVQEAMAALREAAANEADAETLRAAAAQVGNALGHRAVAQVALVKSLKQVLTEEQLGALAELRDERPVRPMQRGANRRMGPRQPRSDRDDFDGPPRRRDRRDP